MGAIMSMRKANIWHYIGKLIKLRQVGDYIVNNFKRILILSLLLSLVTIFVFSPGLVISKFLNNASLLTNIVVYALYAVASISTLGYIIFLIIRKPTETKLGDIDTKEEFIEAFTKYINGYNYLSEEAEQLRKQVFIFDEKVMTLNALLSQKFEGAMASYSKFSSIIRSVKKVVYGNLRNSISLITSFNELDYQRFNGEKNGYPAEIMVQKMETFESYKKEVQSIILQDENIFLKLDKLQLELSKTSSTDNIEINPVIQEMNELISQTKLYR